VEGAERAPRQRVAAGRCGTSRSRASPSARSTHLVKAFFLLLYQFL
jgi:hypothetical protein